MSDLGAEGEAVWTRMRTHMTLSEGFGLVYVFSAHPLVVNVLRERVADLFRARLTRLQREVPAAPEELIAKVLPALLMPPEAEQALGAPLWLELSRIDREGTWRRARLELLARLNEQRERLRKAMRRPLVLVLPAEERTLVREGAPDLWSIRDLVIDTGDWLAVSEPTAHSPATGHRPSEAIEWERVRGSERLSSGKVRAALRASRALREWGDVPGSRDAASAAVEMARRLAGEGEHFLRAALDDLGSAELLLGHWEVATLSFREALAMSRRQRASMGETPETLHTLSVSLANVARIERALGHTEGVEEMEHESESLQKVLATIGRENWSQSKRQAT